MASHLSSRVSTVVRAVRWSLLALSNNSFHTQLSIRFDRIGLEREDVSATGVLSPSRSPVSTFQIMYRRWSIESTQIKPWSRWPTVRTVP